MLRDRDREGHGKNKRGDQKEGRARSFNIHQKAIPREKQKKLRRNCETNNLRKQTQVSRAESFMSRAQYDE